MRFEHDFNQKLEFSLGERKNVDLDVLKSIIHGCVSVEKTSVEIDRTGIDYVATLRGGATINIDAKTREKNASRFWHYGEPELAIETWSVVNKAVGWTFKESSNVDYILYTFQPEDSNLFYFVPFQLLRLTSIKHYHEWLAKYKEYPQPNVGYDSRAIFVPASVVLDALKEQMTIPTASLFEMPATG